MTPSADRTCVACRRSIERDDSLRFVLGPDGGPAIDWSRTLGGRGAWCCWSRTCIEAAPRKLARAFQCAVSAPGGDWPLAQVRDRSVRRQRELLGLASRAGELKAGRHMVERFLRRGWPRYLVRSSDCHDRDTTEWSSRAASHGLDLLTSALDSESLGSALGRPGPRSIVALGPGPLSGALSVELKRQATLI